MFIKKNISLRCQPPTINNHPSLSQSRVEEFFHDIITSVANIYGYLFHGLDTPIIMYAYAAQTVRRVLKYEIFLYVSDNYFYTSC